MSIITTYPNNFKTDSIVVDKDLLYNFNSSIDLSMNEDGVISNSKYSTIDVPNPANNVKFDNVIYSFSGVYITKDRDIIDDNTSYSHAFIIETTNYNLDKRLYISLPVSSVDVSSEINTMLTENTLKDLNLYIPIDRGFYSYKTTINDKISEFIIYKDSTLTIYDDVGISEGSSPNQINVPLTISKNPAMKVSMISNTFSDNDIYIDCQPVDETQQENSIQVISKMEPFVLLVKDLLPYILIFLTFWLLYKGYKGLNHYINQTN